MEDRAKTECRCGGMGSLDRRRDIYMEHRQRQGQHREWWREKDSDREREMQE